MNWPLVLILLFAARMFGGALEWHTTNAYRFASVSPISGNRVGFTSVPAASAGMVFTNYLDPERGLTNQIYYSGSGVACGDVDSDGFVDVYFCSLNGDSRLFRNRGDWKFEDITGRAGVRCVDQASTGAAFADVDGDGDLDLLVTSIGHGVRLFLNDGSGVFAEQTSEAGLKSFHASMTMTLADVDGDGDLDLYVANYRRDTFQDDVNVRFRIRNIGGEPQIIAVNERPVTAPDLMNRYYVDKRGTVHENAEADVLYLNDGHGNFTAASWTDGTFVDDQGRALTAAPLDWGLSAMFRDIDGDGAPDLYVCNDGESVDRIWLNDGRGKFREMPPLALRKTSFSSMSVDFADINRDGFDDFFVADMLGYDRSTRYSLMATRLSPVSASNFAQRQAVPHNTLFLNRGDNTFAEIAQFAGIDASDWSWCVAFLDVDLDGYEDLLITTGLERSLRNADERMAIETVRRQGTLTREQFLEARRRMPRLDLPNFAFRNRGNMTFENTSDSWHFDSRASSHGFALADLDNDGDLDVVIACLNAPPLLYRNETSAPRIGVRLKGARANTRGIGARVEVRGAGVAQSQQMVSGGRFLSSDDAIRVFAAGSATNKLNIEVKWRNGVVTSLTNLTPNIVVEVDEASAIKPVRKTETTRGAIFSDVSTQLGVRHADPPSADLSRQPTLSRRVTSTGPGVTWCELNGRDALWGGGKEDGELKLFTNGSGKFVASARLTNAMDEIGGLVAWNSGGNTNVFAFVSAEPKSGGVLNVFRLTDATVSQVIALPISSASPGPIAAADIDGDGDIDLFIGGRSPPGKYPQTASSQVIRNDKGNFVIDESRTQAFTNVGIVNSAVFTDIDGDGRPELVLACEWDSLRVFRFSTNAVVEITKALALDRFSGWWQSVAAGDFDGDGRMDLVAGNWGRNQRYAKFTTQPVRIYFADTDGDGAVESFEAYHDPVLNKILPTPHWDAMAFRFPFLQQRVRGFADYSTKSLEEVFGEALGSFQMRSANTFDSIVLLNRGDHFESMPLPAEAQFAPVFGVCVADFDGDGNEDVFLGQNFSTTDSDTPRLDAGCGLLLVGKGNGQFRAFASRESGIHVYGDGRGAAACDYDGDGRVDLCVGQQGAETKLFHNELARPGLRVRLHGENGNASGIGAVMRTVFADGLLGPAREVHAGSGWLSQDSAVQVLARNQQISAVEVRWSNGEVTRATVKIGARDLLIKR